jgi:gamma-glutamylcyclotransferase (GGCT)/AIG2-like uncharacterized protein YtfP
MADALFVYGTLRDPEVCTRLLGRMPQSAPARLQGFIRQAVRGEPYPAIVPEGTRSVEGLLLFGLSAPELAALDAYEGDEYGRIEVSVETDAGQARAWVYVWTGCKGRLCTGD